MLWKLLIKSDVPSRKTGFYQRFLKWEEKYYVRKNRRCCTQAHMLWT